MSLRSYTKVHLRSAEIFSDRRLMTPRYKKVFNTSSLLLSSRHKECLQDMLFHIWTDILKTKICVLKTKSGLQYSFLQLYSRLISMSSRQEKCPQDIFWPILFIILCQVLKTKMCVLKVKKWSPRHFVPSVLRHFDLVWKARFRLEDGFSNTNKWLQDRKTDWKTLKNGWRSLYSHFWPCLQDRKNWL